jgi:hypothetical protein
MQHSDSVPCLRNSGKDEKRNASRASVLLQGAAVLSWAWEHHAAEVAGSASDSDDGDRPPPHVLDLGAALDAAMARGGRRRRVRVRRARHVCLE